MYAAALVLLEVLMISWSLLFLKRLSGFDLFWVILGFLGLTLGLRRALLSPGWALLAPGLRSLRFLGFCGEFL